MNDPSQMMMNGGFGIGPPPAPEDPMGFSSSCRLPPPLAAPGGAMLSRVMNWKAKELVGHREKAAAAAATGGVPLGGGGIAGGYNLPEFQEFQYENRVKARRFYSKKKFVRSAPFAPRNTTSFLIRAKKSGGIAPLVSPCPVTPAVLPTPELSPTREDLADLVKEEWGVDGYGSMKGLIRLRSPSGHETRPGEEDGNEEETSSESDVEEHLEVERRLDHDVSRFEMVYPGEEHRLESVSASELLESRVNDQDAHIVQLEEENMTLKGRLFRLDREVAELKKRVLLLESIHGVREDADNKNTNGGNDVEEEDGEECSERSSGAAMAD